MNNQTYNYTSESARAAIVKMMAIYRVDRVSAQEIADYYLKNSTHFSQDAFRVALSDAWGDFNLICPTVLFAEEMARSSQASVSMKIKQNRFYAYRLMQSFDNSHDKVWTGVTHGQEGPFLFATSNQTKHMNSDQQQLSENIIHAFTTFAKTGMPSTVKTKVAEKNLVTVWEEAFNAGNSRNRDFTTRYLHLEANHYHMVDDFWKDRCDRFWKPKIFTG